jgi:hypothetical protein
MSPKECDAGSLSETVAKRETRVCRRSQIAPPKQAAENTHRERKETGAGTPVPSGTIEVWWLCEKVAAARFDSARPPSYSKLNSVIA